MCSLYTPHEITNPFTHEKYWVLEGRRGVLYRESGLALTFSSEEEARRFPNSFPNINVGEEGDRAND